MTEMLETALHENQDVFRANSRIPGKPLEVIIQAADRVGQELNLGQAWCFTVDPNTRCLLR